jgi:hypothetical protein
MVSSVHVVLNEFINIVSIFKRSADVLSILKITQECSEQLNVLNPLLFSELRAKNCRRGRTRLSLQYPVLISCIRLFRFRYREKNSRNILYFLYLFKLCLCLHSEFRYSTFVISMMYLVLSIDYSKKKWPAFNLH